MLGHKNPDTRQREVDMMTQKRILVVPGDPVLPRFLCEDLDERDYSLWMTPGVTLG